jgi:hypothetical protein
MSSRTAGTTSKAGARCAQPVSVVSFASRVAVIAMQSITVIWGDVRHTLEAFVSAFSRCSCDRNARIPVRGQTAGSP